MAESRKSPSKSSELVCPSCGITYHGDDRFCAKCGMPLVPAGQSLRMTPEQERARKIDPRYTDGDPVAVAYAGTPAEKDLIQNILLEEGIPSLARRTGGLGLPDAVMPGPSAIFVPESVAEAAREVLRRSDV